jgi:hypothetical protein
MTLRGLARIGRLRLMVVVIDATVWGLEAVIRAVERWPDFFNLLLSVCRAGRNRARTLFPRSLWAAVPRTRDRIVSDASDDARRRRYVRMKP